MHLDVIPSLRCPREHEPSGLVLVADETRGRHVVSGILGCPVCEAEFPIRARVAYFAEPKDGAPPKAEETLRTAALLGLTDPGGVVMLAGHWSGTADAISEIADALVLVVNPSALANHAERVSVLYAGDRLPIAARAVRAAAIDTPTADVASIVRPRGRVVATNAVPVPLEVTEIARDAEAWVGEVATSGPALALRRGLTKEAP